MNTSLLSRRIVLIAWAIIGCLSVHAQTNGPGYAFSFTGASNAASIATTGSLSGVFTVECWANPGDSAATMGLAGSQSPGDESFAMMFYQGNTVHAEIGNGSNWLTTAADAPLNYTTNVWYHIAYVVTPTNYTIYINGAQAGGGSYAQDNPVLFDADHQLFLGGTGTNLQTLIGVLDEVRVWNTARTQAQIQANMNHTLPLPQDGLVGYWRFDEGSGTNLFDSSTSGFTGTLPNGLGWVPSTAPVDFPLPITGIATDLTFTSATLNGTVNPFGQESLAWFQYGPTTSYGSTTATNDVGSDTNAVAVTNALDSLIPGITYHYQLVATTPNGNTFGADQTFTTSTPGVPALITQPATNITASNATLNASVNPNGAPTSVYFQYGLDTNYGSVSATNNVNSGAASLSVTNLITGLSPGTTYHFQAVAFSSAGTNSGADLSFITPALAPIITTEPASDITASSATLGASVNPDGAPTGVYFQFGLDTNYGSVTFTNNLGGNSSLAVTNPITGLLPGTTYHFQAVAFNSAGTNMGIDLSFITPALAPIITEESATNITAGSANLDASVNPEGAPTSAYFQYGLDTNYGSLTATNSVDSGAISLSVTNLITALSPGTTYHFQLIAFNSVGTNSGVDLCFITPALAPNVTTQPATNITATNATLNASVNPNGAPASVYFQYGLDTNYGSVTSTNNVGGGNASLAVTNFIAGLSPGTTYHFQAVASNSAGTALGADATFTTLPPVFAFTAVNSSLPGITDGSVAWGDFDNDGELDVLLSGIDPSGNPLCQVWRNQGDGTFTNINAGLPGIFYGSAAWGDFDNDGYLDILLTGIATDGSLISQVWRNQGDGTFSNINASLPGVYYGVVAWGDFDNDGKLDILITGHGYSNSICQIWRNQGDGTFSNMNAGLPGMYHSAVSLGDCDNDGNLDVLLAGYDPDVGFITQIWRNQGNGTFTNINAGLPGVIDGGVAWGDFDNDGNLDLVLSGLSTDGVTPLTQIWRNTGNGTFTNINAGLPGVDRSAVAWGDFDNDGNLDLVFSGLSSDGATPLAQVWRNVGNGTFTNINAALTGVYNASVAWGDYNQDGKLDILLSGQGMSGIISQLAQNDSFRADNPPRAPTGLTAVMLTNCVVLSWNAAYSPQTPTHGLSYNLRVGTTPGGSDVFAPQSDVVTGLRRLPQMGNAGTQFTIMLTNLPAGTTYYWSVQGIDTAFAGSPFASETTFGSVVAAIQPVITGYTLGTNGQFQIQFNASAGVSYTLYGNTNLLSSTWTNLANLIAPSNGPAQLTDPTPATLPASFYRLSTP